MPKSDRILGPESNRIVIVIRSFYFTVDLASFPRIAQRLHPLSYRKLALRRKPDSLVEDIVPRPWLFERLRGGVS